MRQATDLKKSLEKVLRKHDELHIDYKARQRRVVSHTRLFFSRYANWLCSLVVLAFCFFFYFHDFAKGGRHFPTNALG